MVEDNCQGITKQIPTRQYWFPSLKYYSDWQLGAIETDLTPLTLRITEDSAKQLVNSLQLTMICMIRLLIEGNVSYVFPAHSEIIPFCEK